MMNAIYDGLPTRLQAGQYRAGSIPALLDHCGTLPCEGHVTDRSIARANHVVVPAIPATVHWGYFSRSLQPVATIESGDFVTIETLIHHAYDDHARMIAGDPGAESVFHWTKAGKNVDRRGAGPVDASIRGRGAGEGFGVHLCIAPSG